MQRRKSDVDGNIQINVRNAGTVSLSTIRDAINTLDDFTATITTGTGDGIYDIDNEDAPVVADLTGGSQGVVVWEPTWCSNSPEAPVRKYSSSSKVRHWPASLSRSTWSKMQLVSKLLTMQAT